MKKLGYILAALVYIACDWVFCVGLLLMMATCFGWDFDLAWATCLWALIGIYKFTHTKETKK